MNTGLRKILESNSQKPIWRIIEHNGRIKGNNSILANKCERYLDQLFKERESNTHHNNVPESKT